MSGFPPSALLQAARLWERTSAKGSRYMLGRLGGVKLVILPNRDYVENDPTNGHTHTLFFSDGSATRPRPHAANGDATATLPLPPPQRAYAARPVPDRKRVNGGGKSHRLEDDVIPFAAEVR